MDTLPLAESAHTLTTTAKPRLAFGFDAGWRIGLVLLVIALPALAAWQTPAPGTLFIGFAERDADAWTYLAKMWQGYDGDWRFHSPYTSQQHEPVAGIFFSYLLLGHVAAWFGISLQATYHLGRILGAAFALVALENLLALFWPALRDRRWAFGLVIAACGFGWVNELNAYWGDARWWPGWLYPAEFMVGHLTPLGSVMRYSHHAIALGLIFACYRQAYQAASERRWPWAAAILACALAWHHPYDVVPVLAALGLWHGLRWRQEGWSSLARYALIAGAAAWPLAYYGSVFRYHPVFSGWAQQNVLVSLPPALNLAAMGFALLFALPNLGQRFGWTSPWGLAACWLMTQSLLIYLPVGWQRHMALGLPFIAMIWGARGLFCLAERWPRHRRAVLGLGLALLLPGPWLMLSLDWATPKASSPDTAELFAWFATEPRRDKVVLASADTGLQIAGVTGHRVIVGHMHETPRSTQAVKAVSAWYRGNGDRTWLRERRIGWVVWGRRERQWRSTPPLDDAPAFRNADYTVWRVGP